MPIIADLGIGEGWAEESLAQDEVIPAVPRAAFVTFAVIAVGSLGSIAGGLLADRRGRSNPTALMLAISGA
jgi:MFS family permease